MQSYLSLLNLVSKSDINILRQKQQFDAHKDSLYDYIETQLTQHTNQNIHLVWQSRSVMAKYYLDAYRLVSEYIFTNETKKRKRMIEKITGWVIKANMREDPHYKLGYEEVLMYMVLRSDLHKFVSKHYENMPELVDLGYVKYPISEKLQARIKELVREKKESVSKITNITCSSMQSYLAFLLTLGLDSDRILC